MKKQKKLIFVSILILISICFIFIMKSKTSNQLSNVEILSSYCDTYSSDASVEFLQSQKGMNGKKTAILVKIPDYSDTYVAYNFTSGEPCQFYVISVWIKTNAFSLNNSTGNGLAIMVNDHSDYNCKYIYSDMIKEDTTNISGNRNGWINLERVVKLDQNGAISFSIRTGWEDNQSKGMVFIDQVQVLPVQSNNEYCIKSSTDGTVRMVFDNSQIKDSGIDSDKMQKWLDIYSNMRKSMKWLVGDVEPYEGTTDYILTEHLKYYGLAGNPIYINTDNVINDLIKIELNTNVKENNILWGLIHEMGHTFDGVGSDTMTLKWNFDAEFFATLKCIYCLYENGYGMGNDFYTGKLVMNHFAKSANLSSGVYSDEGFIYRLMQIMNTFDQEGGWKALHETFMSFNEMPVRDIPVADYDKFQMFIQYLSEHGGKDVKSEFSQEEWNTLITKIQNDM